LTVPFGLSLIYSTIKCSNFFVEFLQIFLGMNRPFLSAAIATRCASLFPRHVTGAAAFPPLTLQLWIRVNGFSATDRNYRLHKSHLPISPPLGFSPEIKAVTITSDLFGNPRALAGGGKTNVRL
jgi:hypothetical protein